MASIIKLGSMTHYDAIIQPSQTSILADADDGRLYSKLDDGTIAIDQSKMTVQTIKEK